MRSIMAPAISAILLAFSPTGIGLLAQNPPPAPAPANAPDLTPADSPAASIGIPSTDRPSGEAGATEPGPTTDPAKGPARRPRGAAHPSDPIAPDPVSVLNRVGKVDQKALIIINQLNLAPTPCPPAGDRPTKPPKKAVVAKPKPAKPTPDATPSPPPVEPEYDQYPNDATVAFDQSLPISNAPAMRRVGRYDYAIYSTDGPPEALTSPGRRVGFFAVKFRNAAASDQDRLSAAWYGARAVQAQLVSLASIGEGCQVAVGEEDRVVIGICSFDDSGANPKFGWLSLERTKDLAKNPRDWLAYASRKSDEVEISTIDDLSDAEFSLETNRILDPAQPPKVSPIPFSAAIEPSHKVGPTGDGLLPVVRVIAAAASLNFSIEFHGQNPPVSFELSGVYSRSLGFVEGLQLGTVELRGDFDEASRNANRAAAYGADVLRRRGETLAQPDLTATRRIGDDRHFVLFARDARSGEKDWLAVLAEPGNLVPTYLPGAETGPASEHAARPLLRRLPHGPEVVGIPTPPRSWLMPFCPPGPPTESFPLYLGGARGARLVEVRLTAHARCDGHFRTAPTPMIDLEYLFLRSR